MLERRRVVPARVGGGAPGRRWSLGRPVAATGVALVVLRVATVLLGGWQHARHRSQLDRGEPFPKPRWHRGVILPALLALMGVVLLVHLVGVGTGRRPTGGMTCARVFGPEYSTESLS